MARPRGLCGGLVRGRGRRAGCCARRAEPTSGETHVGYPAARPWWKTPNVWRICRALHTWTLTFAGRRRVPSLLGGVLEVQPGVVAERGIGLGRGAAPAMTGEVLDGPARDSRTGPRELRGPRTSGPAAIRIALSVCGRSWLCGNKGGPPSDGRHPAHGMTLAVLLMLAPDQREGASGATG